jgi:hypothetical protein
LFLDWRRSDRFGGRKCGIEEINKLHAAFAGGNAIDATLETRSETGDLGFAHGLKLFLAALHYS